MDALWLMLICGVGYLVAYHTYGRFLARKIFKLRPEAVVPSAEFQDGIDYVPTRRGIIFGHHFTSIAGTGPIVGPAIGVIWGWLPALIWVTVGCIFMGAVHDLGSLVVSMRNEGKSISEAAAKYINARVRFIFFAVVFLALLIVIAVFGVVIAVVFARFPSSVAAVWLQIPIAVVLGWMIYKKGASVGVSTAVAVALMYATIWLGSKAPFAMPTIGGMPATGSWTILLLVYAWIASTLPVTTLLQPRDYINAWQLFIMMSLLVLGVIWSSLSHGLPMVAPAVDLSPEGAPPVWPFLFITIACGAVSGFHSLVASGTSPKQIAREPDAQFVGYGSMLLEGALAVLILICVGAGIAIAYTTADGELLTGFDAWHRHYSSWSTASGMGAKLTAVVVGAANMMGSFGLPETVGVASDGRLHRLVRRHDTRYGDTNSALRHQRVGQRPEDALCRQPLGGHDGGGRHGGGSGLRHRRQRTGRPGALASVRRRQPASGVSGPARCDALSEAEERTEVPCHRDPVCSHAGGHELGDGQERADLHREQGLAAGGHRGRHLRAGAVDDGRGGDHVQERCTEGEGGGRPGATGLRARAGLRKLARS